MFDPSVFAANLRTARKRRGLSQQQLAEQLFVSTQAVSKWEQGASVPDVSRLCALAQLLHLSTDALLGVIPAGEDAMIAVDAGGTKTEFVLISHRGRLVKRLVLEGVNPNTCGVQKACEVFCQGIDILMAQSFRVTGIYIGGAGMASAGNADAAEQLLQLRYPNLPLRCESDICNILAHAQTPDNAIAVICGTGSVVYATTQGTLHRFGGGGWRLETAGSGYDIGRQGILAVLEYQDGTGPATAMTEPITQRLGARVWGCIQKIYSEDPGFLASFAPLVLQAWQKEDPVATQIVSRNAERIAHLIHTAAKKSANAKQVMMGGSLLTKNPAFYEKVVSLLDPRLQPTLLTKPPVWGACLQCARLMGVELPDYQLFKETYREES